jgi:hypothetical protein
MRIGTMFAVASLAALASCGGSTAGGTGAAVNAFTGSLKISSALPAGMTTCGSTQTVVFTAGGANVHDLTLAGGDCLKFTNNDTAPHQPAAGAGNPCLELNAPGPLAQSQSFTTVPLSGPKDCNWMDALNPPGGGGGY